MLAAARLGQHRADGHRVGVAERGVLDVDGSIGAARQRFTQDLRGARRAGRADDDLAAVRLAEPQRLLERVRVRLVQLPARVLLTDRPADRRPAEAATRAWGPA